MIDTNELRRLAQAAMHPVTKGRWMRLFGERTVYDRMEDGCRGIPVVSTPVSPPHPFEAACLDFIAAANPAVVIEILDRLEAAESEALEQARLNGMGAEREAALLAKLEAAEKERDALRSKIETAENDDAHQKALAASALRVAEGWERKCGELRAKIEAMERQEPVAWCATDETGTVIEALGMNHSRRFDTPLYLTPGAQGEIENG